MSKKLKIRHYISIFCILFFSIIAILVVKKDSLYIDRVGYEFVSSFISDFRTPFVKFITYLGGAQFVIPLFAIVLIIFVFIGRKRDTLLLGLCLFFQTLLNYVLKHIFRRTRPSVLRLIKQGGYSFPSGHTMVSCAFYGYLMYIVYKNVKNKYLKWGIISFLSILVFLIGCSRIYLGVHYTSDVLAGFFISIAYLIIFIEITKKIKK